MKEDFLHVLLIPPSILFEASASVVGGLKRVPYNYIFKVHYGVHNKLANLPSFEYVATWAWVRKVAFQFELR